MAARRKWGDLSGRTRTLIITVAVADGILKAAALIDMKRAGKPDPGPEVGVGPSGHSGQLRRGRADLILRIRAPAAAVAIRLTSLTAPSWPPVDGARDHQIRYSRVSPMRPQSW